RPEGRRGAPRGGVPGDPGRPPQRDQRRRGRDPRRAGQAGGEKGRQPVKDQAERLRILFGEGPPAAAAAPVVDAFDARRYPPPLTPDEIAAGYADPVWGRANQSRDMARAWD